MRTKNRIKPILNKIEKLWLKNPDFRLWQLLINNWFNCDWNFEWDEVLEPHELYWTSVLDKDWKPLKSPVTRWLWELSKEHLNNILNTQYLSDKYLEAIYWILKLSEKKKKAIEVLQKELYKKKYDDFYLRAIKFIEEDWGINI